MLSFRSLPLRSLAFHRGPLLPVLLGVAVGAAVLTGSLLVGDSLRGSLRARAERQLQGVKSAWVGPRLVREEAVRGLPDTTPLLLLGGSARSADSRLSRVAVVGLADADRERFGLPPGVVLGHRVAERLNVRAGGTVVLGLEKGSRVPRASLVGRRDAADVTASIRLTVDAVLPPDHGMNDFSLNPAPAPPLNVFVPPDAVRGPLALDGRVNAAVSTSTDSAALNAAFHAKLLPIDRGLKVLPGDTPDPSELRQTALAKHEYVLVESENAILDGATVTAVEEAAKRIGARSERTLAYLANAVYPGTQKIANADDPATPVMRYAVVGVVDPTAAAPLGPFLPPGVNDLAENEIALLDWPDSPLPKLNRGDPVTVAYFKPEMEAGAVEAWKTFRFAGYVPFTAAADDPNLTPPFPGVTDKPTIKSWNAPFEINAAYKSRPPTADDSFWNSHQATPKAYIRRAKRDEPLFESRFGEVTSIRVAPAAGRTREQTADALRRELRTTLDPTAVGLVFTPIHDDAVRTSEGGTDFAAMLLAFSGLLILAALVLVAMLFRLAVDRRAKEVGLLLAAGYTPKQTRLLLMVEGLLVSVAGAVLGAGAAVLYAWGMLKFLGWLWPDPTVGTVLRLYVHPGSLVIGAVSTVVVAVFAIWLGVRRLVKVPPPALLRGETAVPALKEASNARRSLWVAAGCAVIGVALLAAGPLGGSADARAGTFFGGGLLLLASGVFVFRWWLLRPRHQLLDGTGPLGVRNTTRAAGRSLLTVALLGLATFLLVAVESFRKRPDAQFAEKTGGSGGFPLLAEADIPVFHRLDAGSGRADVLRELQKQYQDQEGDVAGRVAAARADLERVKALPFRLHGGDDASCLNLQAAARPRVIGAPDELTEDRRFAFAMSEAKTAEQKANPWLLLTTPLLDAKREPLLDEKGYPVLPVILEINTALWQLKTFLGGTLRVPDGSGKQRTLRVVGLLQDSVFQSELIVSDKSFRDLYPLEEGYRLFLLDAPADKHARTAELLENGLRANGLTVTPTSDRVAGYQAVIGAYLSTFQLLGGLGLGLGVFGLAAVMLRAIWERAGELALLRAVGYETADLQKMVLVENVVLLLVGVGVGLVAALLAVLPNLALGGQLGSLRLAGLLAGVLVAGVLVALLTTLRAAQAPLIPSLRKE